MTTEAPSWAKHGLRPWPLLVWLPLCYSLLIAPISSPTPSRHSPAAWILAGVAAIAFTAITLTRYWRPRPRADTVARLLLALLAALALITTLLFSPAWSSLFVLLAIGVGIVLGGRLAPSLILVIAVVATASSLLIGALDENALTTGLSVLLAGFGTSAVYQLFAVVAELQCAREELARMAVSQERERFARDLHDLLGHTLSVIVVKAEAVRRLAPIDNEAAVVHAADIENIGREALTDIRHAISGYRGAGLGSELSRARAALEAAGVALTLEPDPAEGSDSLPDETDALLGWVVREGVTNVVRHSQASHCAISLARPSASTIRLTIDDDGSGGELVSHRRGTGVGLLGLEERTAAAGGTFVVAQTSQGFRITVDMPCGVRVGAR